MNNSNEVLDVLGIDISKAKFDVALIQGNAKIKSKVFGNNPDGFAELQEWLNLQSVTNLQREKDMSHTPSAPAYSSPRTPRFGCDHTCSVEINAQRQYERRQMSTHPPALST